MKNFKIYSLLILSGALLICSSCEKYLDAKPSINLEIPSTVDDLQSLLNKGISCSAEAVTGSDDYYEPYSSLISIGGLINQENYYWDLPNDPTTDNGWENFYSGVFYANVVLDDISVVSLDNEPSSKRDQVKGEALFNRAFIFFEVEKVWGQPYKAATANTDLGICLRTTSSVTTKSDRATVQQTYVQIISDLKSAVELLPTTAAAVNLATKQAAYAELARVYLSMSDFKDALTNANACLAIQNNLLGFNSLDSTATYPMPSPRLNKEIVFYAQGLSLTLISPKALVDTTLYESYDNNDLRKRIFFKYNSLGGYTFNGGYVQNQSAYIFSGLATDEMYLIKAECHARLGDVNSHYGIDDLNTLLITRWKSGTFSAYTATGQTDALNQILAERRKELIWRGTRWDDLRRLNQDPNYAITLTRNLNGTVYTLPPNDPHYAFLLPPAVIQLGGLPQNPR